MTITLLLCISLLCLTSIRMKQFKDFILPNIYIAEVDIGRLTRQDAEAKLNTWAKALTEKPITLVYGGQEWSFFPSQLMDFRVKETIDAAFEYCEDRSNIERILGYLQIKKTPVYISPVIEVKEPEYEEILGKVKLLVGVPPKDAAFIIDDDKITIIKDIDGFTLDMEKLKVDLKDALLNRQTTMKIPVKRIQALKTEKDLQNMCINEKAMEFSTVFDPNKKDRTQNIKLAAEAVTGHIIPPDGIFSFNEVVGERTGDKGYKEAPIFYDSQIVPGMGGGICQLSSTIYNLALLSDLEIIERANHSLPVDYVPLGRDATVNYGSIDLKFKNNSQGFLLLHAEIDGDTLRVMFFGPNKFANNIELFSETVKTISPPVYTKKDVYLEKGTTRVKQGTPGYQVRLWKIYNDGVEATKQLISADSYQPIHTTIYEGEKEIEQTEAIFEKQTDGDESSL